MFLPQHTPSWIDYLRYVEREEGNFWPLEVVLSSRKGRWRTTCLLQHGKFHKSRRLAAEFPSKEIKKKKWEKLSFIFLLRSFTWYTQDGVEKRHWRFAHSTPRGHPCLVRTTQINRQFELISRLPSSAELINIKWASIYPRSRKRKEENNEWEGFLEREIILLS